MDSKASPFTTLKMTELRWILPLKPKAGLNGPPAIYSLRMYVMPTSRKSGEKWGTLSCDSYRQEAGHPSVLRVAFLFRVRLVSFYN